jgi:virginiamycin B lyase
MTVTEYDVGPGAYGVALAADGAAWTSLVERGELARVGPGGDVSRISLGLCAGPDRTLWYTLLNADRAGRLCTGGGTEEFPLPDRSCRPHTVAAAADGGCWVALWAASSVVRLDDDGRLADETSFPPGAEPHGIALAPDETVWVALEAGTLAHLTYPG